jgi:hypoxanthine phosphoribosyltransferase
MPNDKRKLPVMYTADQIHRKVISLGAEIAADYPTTDPLYLIGVLKGAFVFLSDLARAIPRPVRIDFIGASSYGSGTQSTGKVTLTRDLSADVSGADVLVVEDIIDTGITLDYLLKLLAAKKPKSLRVASLLAKPERLEVEVPIHYLGFSIPNEFVVGYGMDHAEEFRDLPDICRGAGS